MWSVTLFHTIFQKINKTMVIIHCNHSRKVSIISKQKPLDIIKRIACNNNTEIICTIITPSIARRIIVHISRQVFWLEYHHLFRLPNFSVTFKKRFLSYSGGTVWDFHPSSLLINTKHVLNLFINIQFLLAKVYHWYDKLSTTIYIMIKRYSKFNMYRLLKKY